MRDPNDAATPDMIGPPTTGDEYAMALAVLHARDMLPIPKRLAGHAMVLLDVAAHRLGDSEMEGAAKALEMALASSLGIEAAP